VVTEPSRKDSSGILVCGGCARLPGSQAGEMLVVEVEVDRNSLCIVEVHVSPKFGGLRQLLKSELEGTLFTDITTKGVAAINHSYLSPFRSAARAALAHAAESYTMAQKRPRPVFLRDQ
jgi:hypothetical protein